MPSYCVSDTVLDSGERIVHRLDASCSLIPNEEHRHYLGQLQGDGDAMSKAADKFDCVDGCPDCMPDHNDHTTRQAVDASIAALITVMNL